MCPLTNEDAWLARKIAAPCSSSTLPQRPAGVRAQTQAENFSSFISAVARGRMLGVQFHPERSGPYGLRFLGNVVDMVRRDGGVDAAASPVETGPAVEVAASAVQVAAPAVESVV